MITTATTTPPATPTTPSSAVLPPISTPSYDKKQLAPKHEDSEITYIQLPNMPLFKIRKVPYKWEEVKEIIQNNELEKFARLESQSDTYLSFKKSIAEQGLTVYKYLLKNQLQWNPVSEDELKRLKDEEIIIEPKLNRMFTEPSDLKILKNDFPYNFEEGIYHLCIWTKFIIPTDPNSPIGDISSTTRKIIEKYLYKTFSKYGVEWDNLIWFKNWESLQSVKSLSHIHVIINGLTPEVLDELLYTSGEPLTIEELEELE